MAELQTHSQEEMETDSGVVATKRQRRPSVRLGDIGGPDARHHHRYYCTHHQSRWRAAKHNSKTLPSKPTLDDDTNKNVNTNDCVKKKKKSNSSGSGNYENNGDTKEGDFGDAVATGIWEIRDMKSKQGLVNGKRARSDWPSKSHKDHHRNQKRGPREIDRTFQPVNSEDEKEEEDQHQQQVHDNTSPTHSLDNDDIDNIDNNVTDNGSARDKERGNNMGGARSSVHLLGNIKGPHDSSQKNGVRVWLNKLGLDRYAPVFEIHEVDDEVLPLLTVDDLKDMGISSVGSRRKLYCSIQKLNKGFS